MEEGVNLDNFAGVVKWYTRTVHPALILRLIFKLFYK
jgi:hypothetical protein